MTDVLLVVCMDTASYTHSKIISGGARGPGNPTYGDDLWLGVCVPYVPDKHSSVVKSPSRVSIYISNFPK